MRLLASTDYALRLLVLIARARSEDTTSVETLARTLALSRNHLHKIVQELRRLRVVDTIRGVGGGVRLARPAAELRIGALVRALEADQPVVECFRAGQSACTLDPDCRLRPMLRKAREAFYHSLDAHTLADFAGPPARARPPPVSREESSR